MVPLPFGRPPLRYGWSVGADWLHRGQRPKGRHRRPASFVAAIDPEDFVCLTGRGPSCLFTAWLITPQLMRRAVL